MKALQRCWWLVCVPGIALAHPGHETAGLLQGAMHPLTGFDHLLAMIAVGIWASQCAACGRQALRWQLPLAFVATMLLGAILGAGQMPVNMMEQGIAASVLVLGLLIARAAVLPASLGTALVACFALLHGYAHGAEAHGAVSLMYLAGMSLGTLLLHLSGLLLAQSLLSKAQSATVRWIGAAIAVSGVALLAA